MDFPVWLFKSFNLNLGKFSLPVSYLQATAVIILIFVLVLSMAHYRRHYVDWSLKGGFAGVIFGFLFALILEGFLLVGGKTVLTEMIGWRNAPKPISVVLDAGRSKLIEVLGTDREKTSVTSVVGTFQSLNPDDSKKAKSLICQP